MNPDFQEAPHDVDDPLVQHLRWHSVTALPGTTSEQPMSWKETLEAMCLHYGTFRGRWHENEFWRATLKQVQSITEQEALNKILQIEREADGALQYWRTMQ